MVKRQPVTRLEEPRLDFGGLLPETQTHPTACDPLLNLRVHTWKGRQALEVAERRLARLMPPEGPRMHMKKKEP